jgi:hypothetical protein
MTEQEKRAYQDRMQRLCGFSSPQEAWDAIEKHTHPEAVYEKLVAALNKSNDATGMNYGSTPEQHRDFIQKRCNFENPDKVFGCLSQHKHWKDFYRVLAQSMANARYQ